MGTDTCGQRSNLEEGGIHTHRKAPLDRDPLGLENLGDGPWFAGKGGGGEAT